MQRTKSIERLTGRNQARSSAQLTLIERCHLCAFQVVLCLRAVYLPQLERIIHYGEIARRMYIVRRGIVGVNGWFGKRR